MEILVSDREIEQKSNEILAAMSGTSLRDALFKDTILKPLWIDGDELREKISKIRITDSFSAAFAGDRDLVCSKEAKEYLTSHKDELLYCLLLGKPSDNGGAIYVSENWIFGSDQKVLRPVKIADLRDVKFGYVDSLFKVDDLDKIIVNEWDMEKRYEVNHDSLYGCHFIKIKESGNTNTIVRLTPIKKYKVSKKNSNIEREIIVHSSPINHIKSIIVAEWKRLLTEWVKQDTSDKVEATKNSFNAIFDPNGDGLVDIELSSTFGTLIKVTQKDISAIDRAYVQKFVKLNSYLAEKSANINSIFKMASGIEKFADLKSLSSGLMVSVQTYESLLLHSCMMVDSLINEDMVTFYEIYEAMEKLAIFDSAWEKKVTSKLSSIDSRLSNVERGLMDILSAIHSTERTISEGLDGLAVITSASIQAMSNRLDSKLSGLGTKIDLANSISKKHLEFVTGKR